MHLRQVSECGTDSFSKKCGTEWGCDVKKAVEHGLNIPEDDQIFNQLLFSKIVPNCRKLGLLDAGDGWLREKYTEIGVIELEHLEDTGEEYSEFSIEDDQLASSSKSIEGLTNIQEIRKVLLQVTVFGAQEFLPKLGFRP